MATNIENGVQIFLKKDDNTVGYPMTTGDSIVSLDKNTDFSSVKTKVDSLNTDVSTHTANKNNPHGVTKAQLGLNNVENKSSATIRGELTSANVTTALTYTPAKSDDLTSHTGNKSNPHGVTKAQVGLGNVENKSSATIRGELTSANVTTALGFTPSNSAATALTNENLNNITTVGDYYAGGSNTVTNKPSGVDAFALEVYRNATGYLAQRLTSTNVSSNNGDIYIRVINSGSNTYGDWAKVYTTTNKPTKADIGLSNVENKSSATIRGELTSDNVTTALKYTPANITELTSHTGNTSNPHSVTKAQVGLGNVPNVATNDQTPTFTAATTLATLTSGEKLSVSLGKTAKAITDLSSHLNNKSNPHGVTKSQLGLGNVENKSSATIRGELTKDNVTTALGYTPPKQDTNTWRDVVDNLTSTATDKSLSANQGKVLNESKLPHATISTTKTDFDTLKTTCIYHIKITDGVNQPTANNGTLFVDATVGTMYQLWIPDTANTMYKRTWNSTDGKFNSWVQSNLTNTWRGIQNNLTSDSTTDSLAAAQGKVLNTAITSHTGNTSNPHSVTKAQVGLGNVPNVSTNDQTPTFTAATTLATLTSGEKLSVSLGKTAKAITDLSSHLSNTSNPHGVTKSQLGLGNVENKSSATIRGELTSANVTTALGFTPSNSNHTHNYAGSSSAGGAANSAVKLTTARKIGNASFDGSADISLSSIGAVASSSVGVANGVASLDSNGKVPSNQLPSYVDDVLEYDDKSKFPTNGETGKIYVDKTTNLTYRWSGTAYVEISPSIALGETSSTAFAGDKGKTAYDHVSNKSNPHGVTKSQLGLGNVENKSSATIRGELTSANVTTALGYTPPKQDTTYADFTGASSSAAGKHGLVPAPAQGNQNSFLRGDGTWATPTDTKYSLGSFGITATATELNYVKGVTSAIQTQLNGKSASGHTHSAATTNAAGFMSAADKSKLDGIASGATKITVDSTLNNSSTNPVQNKVINAALAGKSATNHTHSYAGSTSAGGAANSAVKLAAARKISLAGEASGSASFDGSGDISINASVHRKYAMVGSDTANSAGWYKVASITMSGYGNSDAVYSVSSTYATYNTGILVFKVRSDNTSISVPEIGWLTRHGFSVDSVRVVISGMTATLYVNQTNGQYGRILFEVISESSINAINAAGFTYYNSTTKEATTPTASTATKDLGTVSYANSAGSASSASSAAKLTTARKIGNASFDGSGDISLSSIGAAASGHTHNYAGSGSAGGSANSAVKLDTATAGSATQPVYFTGGKPTACTYSLNKTVPADAKFTDTNTWRDVVDNLTSTDATKSLSAKQGNTLNTSITNHVNNKSNPHGVTKAQLGLGNVENKSSADLLNLVYPVGAIYISTANTNPGKAFGGTWEALTNTYLVTTSTTNNENDTWELNKGYYMFKRTK